MAGLAYLSAKLQVGTDIRVIYAALRGWKIGEAREKKDRLNYFYLLEETAQDKKLGDHVFVIFEGRKWTYKQTYDIVLRYGTWLRETYDVKPKDIVAMDFENSDQFVFMWLGLWSIGARPAFLNYNLSGQPLIHCIRASAAKLVLIDPNVQKNVTEDVRQALPDIKFVVFTPELENDALTSSPVRAPDSARSGEKLRNMAMLIYTSGTTGLPKPAVVSLAKCIIGGNHASKWLGAKQSDILYTVRTY